MTPDQRIDDLEYRLHQYHQWLEASIAERDRLALDAAWGVHYALYYLLALAAFLGFLGKYGDDLPWWGSALSVVTLIAIQIAVHAWSNGMRMKEVDRLAKLPEWEWKFR